MVNMFASNVWFVGSSPWQVKPKTIKLVFVASPHSIKEREQRLVCPESGLMLSRKSNISTRWLLLQWANFLTVLMLLYFFDFHFILYRLKTFGFYDDFVTSNKSTFKVFITFYRMDFLLVTKIHIFLA